MLSETSNVANRATVMEIFFASLTSNGFQAIDCIERRISRLSLEADCTSEAILASSFSWSSGGSCKPLIKGYQLWSVWLFRGSLRMRKYSGAPMIPASRMMSNHPIFAPVAVSLVAQSTIIQIQNAIQARKMAMMISSQPPMAAPMTDSDVAFIAMCNAA